MPPKAAHYIWSYFHGMSSALYLNMGEIAHIPSKGLTLSRIYLFCGPELYQWYYFSWNE
jgi:hypothetical protein